MKKETWGAIHKGIGVAATAIAAAAIVIVIVIGMSTSPLLWSAWAVGVAVFIFWLYAGWKKEG